MPSSHRLNRRHFLKASAVAAGLTLDTLPLKAQMEAGGQGKPKPASGRLPAGRIGKLEVARLICGGNLFSGFAHSGDLLYVHSLLQHYFTDDKILDTLQLCEEGGINTTILRTDEQIVRVLKRYRKERRGNIQWIAQTYPEPDNLKDNIKLAIDNSVGYHSQDTRDVAALMKTIKKPWIAFKVLGAGRVLPEDGFDLAFKSGADFINVGMYDFQVESNISLVCEVVKRHERRDRTWA